MANLNASIARLKGYVARWLPPCNHIVFLLSQAMDRQLPMRDRLFVKTHLAICPNCCLCQEQLDYIRNLLQGFDPIERKETRLSTAVLSPEARDRLKRLLSTANSDH